MFFGKILNKVFRQAAGVSPQNSMWLKQKKCSKSFQASSGKSLNYSAVKLVSSAALDILARPLLPSILLVQTV